jgi:hypothetical protein
MSVTGLNLRHRQERTFVHQPWVGGKSSRPRWPALSKPIVGGLVMTLTTAAPQGGRRVSSIADRGMIELAAGTDAVAPNRL